MIGIGKSISHKGRDFGVETRSLHWILKRMLPLREAFFITRKANEL